MFPENEQLWDKVAPWDRIAMWDRVALWDRVVQRDRQADGVFFYGVKTTGIFCKPSCAARPKPANVLFFQLAEEAMSAGFRPCKRCHPERLASVKTR